MSVHGVEPEVLANEGLLEMVQRHGTPLFIIDHEIIRENYGDLRRIVKAVEEGQPEKASQLHRQLVNWRSQLHAKLPRPNAAYVVEKTPQ